MVEFVWDGVTALGGGLTALEVALGVVLLMAGVGLGVWLRRGGRATRERIRELEAEVLDGRGRLEAQQQAVTKHFTQTSDLFRDLTSQYSALYAHLAEGARELCDDRIPEIGQGFAEPLLARGGASAEVASEIAPPDEPSNPLPSLTESQEPS